VRAAAVVGAMVGLFWPVLGNREGFPPSTYPAYSSGRPGVATFVTAHGVQADGSLRRLSMDVIYRSDDPLIAASRLAHAAGAGQAAACRPGRTRTARPRTKGGR